MNATTTITAYVACRDCYQYAAYGSEALDTMTEQDGAIVAAGIDALAVGGAYVTTGTDMNYGFSWGACECCKRPLGGDRFEVLVIAPRKECMTPSRLKALHLEHNPESHFFSRENMRFFGDTMKNYAIVEHDCCFELRRRRPVKHGLKACAYFDKQTYALRHDLGAKPERILAAFKL